MVDVLPALLPVGLLIVVGWVMRLSHFPGEQFWPLLDKLIYFALLPVLLFNTALKTDLTFFDALPMGLATALALLALTLLLFLLRPFVAPTGAAFSSVIQGAVRVNIYAGFAIAAALYGDRGVLLFSLVIAFAIPLDNLISIAALNMFASSTPSPGSLLLRRIALNPLILSLAFGFALGGFDLTFPRWFLLTLDLVGDAALPLALMAVGAGISFVAPRSALRPLIVAVLARLLALPILAFGFCHLVGLSGLERSAVLLHAVLPTGPAAYAVAKQLGGDAPLMANIISATTLFAAVAVPLWLWLLVF